MEDNIYILRVFGRGGESFIKVGYSSQLESRLNTYKLHNPLFEVVMTFYSEYGREIEYNLHKKFESVVLNEWYKESKLPDIISYIINFSSDNISDCENLTTNNAVKYDLAIPSDEHIRLLNILTPREYYVFMKMCFMMNKKTMLIVGVNYNDSSRKLESAFGIERKSVRQILNKLINESLIDVSGNRLFVNDNFIKVV